MTLGGGLLPAEPVAARDSDCDRFILAAGSDPGDKFKHVDDDFKVELQRKGHRRWKTIFEDSDGTVNDGGKHIRPISFRAHYGDKLRITATNKQAGGCGLDQVYLFCKGDKRGKKLLGRTRCSGDDGKRVDYVFLEKTKRLRS